MSLVADASALGEYLLETDLGRVLAAQIEAASPDLHVPAVHDLEICSALRRLIRFGEIDETRAIEALEDLVDLPLTVHAHNGLLQRVLQLRENFSAYDASYVALAEALGAQLLTCDAPLARGVRTLTSVEVVAVPGVN